MPRLEELDEERREFYFSKLSNSNQLSKNEKIAFWNGILKSRYLIPNSKFTFEPATIGKEFVFGPLGQEPACILQIISILMKESVLVDANRPENDQSIVSEIFSEVYSVLKTLFGSSGNDDDHDEEILASSTFPKVLLHHELLEECCLKVFKFIKMNNTLLLDKVDFASSVKQALGFATLDDNDLKMIERLLIKQNKLLVGKQGFNIESSTIVYKFHIHPTTVIAPITEIDFGRLTLKRTACNLTKQIEAMHLDIERLRAEIKVALSEKAKPKAMLSLKRAKRLEEIVEKRSNSLLTIEQIIEKIESAESEEKILQAYSVGSKALRSIISRTDIGQVENTMDELAEVLADQREIESVMEQGQEEIISSHQLKYEDSDLEKELEALLIQEDHKVADQLTETLKTLPSISTAIDPVPVSVRRGDAPEKQKNDGCVVSQT